MPVIKRSRHQNYTEKTEMICETKKQMIILGNARKAGKDLTGRLSEEGRGNEGSCKSCLPCFIAVVLDFDQRLL